MKNQVETIKNEAKEEKSGLLGMLLGTSVASLLGSALQVKELFKQMKEWL